MKKFLILSLVVLAVLAAPESREAGQGARPTRAPFTEEQKKKYQEEREAILAKLSPEAREASDKIVAAWRASKEDPEAVKKAIEAIKAPLSESVKKELESLKPKHDHNDGHKGHKHAPPTEEQKKKFEEALKEKVAKLSPEAQAAHEKIKAAFKLLHKTIEEIKAPLSESVKKELESLVPKGHHHHDHKEHDHKGHNHGGKGTRGPRATTAAPESA